MQELELNFDLTPQVLKVNIGGERYVLREPTGDAVCKWRNRMIRAAKMTDGKLTSMDGIADGEPFLVSLCLFKVTDKGEFPVAEPAIRSWRGSIQKRLFDECKRMGGLDDDETPKSIEEKIEELQEKLQKLREEGTPAGKSLPAATDNCATAVSSASS